MPEAKHEFAGATWVAELRTIVEVLLGGHDLTGIDYTFCEEFTDPPDHLRRNGAARRATGRGCPVSSPGSTSTIPSPA